MPRSWFVLTALLLGACASDAESRRAEQAALDAERARDSALRAEDEAWGHAAGAAIAGQAQHGAPAEPPEPGPRAEPLPDWPDAPEDPDPPVDEPPPVIYGREVSDEAPARTALPAPPQVDHRPLAHGDVPALVALEDWPEPAAGRVVHVAERRARHGADGSAERPHPTLAAALEGAGPGTVILVEPAEYEEHVTLPAGVTLRGRRVRGQLPVIRGTVTLGNGTRLVDVEVTQRGDNPRGIVGRDVTDVVLRGVTVRDVAEAGDYGTVCGIDLVGCRRVAIEGCVVRDLTERMWGGVAGIRLVACQARLWGTWVLGVHEDDWDSAYGILAVGSDLTLSGVVVADVHEDEWADAYGIRLVDCYGVVSHATVVNVTADDFWGTSAAISLDASCLVTLERCIVAHAARGIVNASKGSIVRTNAQWNAMCDGPQGDDLIVGNVEFADEAYRLKPGSPARGLGAWAAPRPDDAWEEPSKVLRRALQRVPELERQASLDPD